jgi:hypothetical protein
MESALRPFDQKAIPSWLNKAARLLHLPMKVDQGLWGRHDGLQLMQSLTKDQRLNELTSFAVVRDPYSHARSHYNFMKSLPAKRFGDVVQKLTFEQYLEIRRKPIGIFRQIYDRDRWFFRLPDQASMLCDREGQLIVSRVLKFENLQADWETLCDDLGLGDLPLGHSNKGAAHSSKGSPTVLTPQGKELVEEIYARDFDLFGYKKKESHL